MKSFLFLLSCLLFFTSAGQEIKVYYENKEAGYIMYADNNEFCPSTVSLDLTLKNMHFSNADNVVIIPAMAQKFKLGEINRSDVSKAYTFSYRYNYTRGNTKSKNYNDAYVYDLPFKKGKEFRLYQGYNGLFSHQNENALDFTMPEGTEIVAAREGVIVKVVQDNTENCGRRECAKFNNYITVYHSDGTFGEYMHIKYKGSVLKPGDVIKKGDLIAYSGNTGWSSGPHLHFVCYLPDLQTRQTISTNFRIGDGVKVLPLKEGEIYLKNY